MRRMQRLQINHLASWSPQDHLDRAAEWLAAAELEFARMHDASGEPEIGLDEIGDRRLDRITLAAGMADSHSLMASDKIKVWGRDQVENFRRSL